MNLSGIWSCPDQLTYYITQVGKDVFLHGRDRESQNVGFGTFNPSNNTLTVKWADLPNSNGFGNRGAFTSSVASSSEIVLESGDESFGIGTFSRIS
jgi:hypothetical protein